MTAGGVTIPREGSSNEENEDAMRWRADSDIFVACVSDGATESVYSRAWAVAIAEGFVRDAPTDVDSFERCHGRWREEFRAGLPRGHQPWYVANRIDEGSYAAFVGIVMAEGILNVLAVGDCCLLREVDGVVRSWPIEEPDAFDSRPGLLGSEDDATEVLRTSLPVRTGDRVILASDAAAEWLLRRGFGGLAIGSLPDQIQHARRSRALRNDDATILIVDTR
jgi:hypothetical protein